MEKMVETHICRHCGASFDITDKDLEFYEKISPIFPTPGVEKETPGLKLLENGKIKYLIPSPTLCPDCRQQRRLSFRNERKLYKRKCDATGEDIISTYSPDKLYKVYNQEFWWSDKWEALDYGKDFNFNKSFFEQFEELMKEVPRNTLINVNPEESDYINCAAFNKSCYLSFDIGYSEKCFYSRTIYESNNVFDSLYIANCQNCYECINSFNIYKSIYSFNCFDSANLGYCVNCRNCTDCFLCHNIENQKYMIKNRLYSKEDYEKELFKYKNRALENIFDYKEMLKNSEINMFINCEDCSGAFQKNSKKCYFSFGNVGSEDSKYLLDSYHAKNCYDDCFCGIDNSEMNLETLGNQDSKSSIVLSGCFNGSYKVFYSDSCHACSNCFGCIGLRNKEYCILNKQYTKEEYEKLVPKIIEHMSSPHPSPAGEGIREWGEFFPSSLSPFGYNETIAQEYYPINTPPIPHPIPQKEKGNNSYLFSFSLGGKDAGKADRGTFNWSTYEAPFPKVEKIIPASKLPENIADIPNDILNWAIECEVTKKPFRIIKEELEFYRKHNLPIPRRHPDQRHLDRMHLRKSKEKFSKI